MGGKFGQRSSRGLFVPGLGRRCCLGTLPARWGRHPARRRPGPAEGPMAGLPVGWLADAASAPPPDEAAEADAEAAQLRAVWARPARTRF